MTDIFKIKKNLDDTAQDLTQILPVEELRGLVIYFLESLATRSEDPEEFEEMLDDLLEDIEIRIDTGKW